jgi:hypothetical protein
MMPLIYQDNSMTVLFFLTEWHKTVSVSLDKAEDKQQLLNHAIMQGMCSLHFFHLDDYIKPQRWAVHNLIFDF